MKRVVFHTGRKGISMVECVILIVVLMIAVGAVFTTLGMAQRNYAQHKQDKQAREVLFAWSQAFESLWPPPGFDIDSTPTMAQVINQIMETNDNLGYQPVGDNGAALAGGLYIHPTPSVLAVGRIVLDITIKLGSNGKTIVGKTGDTSTGLRSYNKYNSVTVVDVISEDVS